MILIESYWDTRLFSYAGIDIPYYALKGYRFLTVDIDGTVKAHDSEPSFSYDRQSWDSYVPLKVAKVDLQGLDPEMTMKKIR